MGHMPGILKLRVERLLLPRLIRGLDKYKRCSKTLTEACIQDRLISAADSRNVIQFLLNKNADGDEVEKERFSASELVSETSLLIVAGKWTHSTWVKEYRSIRDQGQIRCPLP